MLKYIQITNKNLEFATNIQMKIFPNESAYRSSVFFSSRVDGDIPAVTADDGGA